MCSAWVTERAYINVKMNTILLLVCKWGERGDHGLVNKLSSFIILGLFGLGGGMHSLSALWLNIFSVFMLSEHGPQQLG